MMYYQPPQYPMAQQQPVIIIERHRESPFALLVNVFAAFCIVLLMLGMFATLALMLGAFHQ